jgi:hypothetical protein
MMVNFKRVENKVHFEINIGATKQACLRISSQLPRLAKFGLENRGMR